MGSGGGAVLGIQLWRIWVRILENRGLVTIAVEELDGVTTWFPFINQLRPHAEDCSLPKDCWKAPVCPLNLLVPCLSPALLVAVGTCSMPLPITTALCQRSSPTQKLIFKTQHMQIAQATARHSEKKESKILAMSI